MIPILQSTRSSRLTSSPLITDFRQGRTYKELIPYYEKRYSKTIHPVRRRSECDIQDSCTCPRCDAPKHFLYKNNGSKGQLLIFLGRQSILNMQKNGTAQQERSCCQ